MKRYSSPKRAAGMQLYASKTALKFNKNVETRKIIFNILKTVRNIAKSSKFQS